MKQIVQNYRTGVLKVTETPSPQASEGGIVVRNAFSLISPGTERGTISTAQKSLAGKAKERPDLVRKVLKHVQKNGLAETMKMVLSRLDSPAALGYSCAGWVKRVGSGVDDFTQGERVACAGQNYASHAEEVWVPGNLCVRIPDQVTFEEASFVTLGAIALQGIRQTQPQLGEWVAVIGLGLIGQLTIQMLMSNGCRVIASDPDPQKRALALKSGVEEAVPPEKLETIVASRTEGYGVDSAVVTAATKDNGPIRSAAEICRKKGRVVVVGLVGMDLPRDIFYAKELDLRLSTSYGPGRYDPEYEEKGRDYPYGYVRWTERRNMAAFLDLIAAKRIDVSRLITHSYEISEAEKAYEMILAGKMFTLAVLLSYPDQPQEDTRKTDRVELTSPPKNQGKMGLALIDAGNHVQDRLLSSFKKHPHIQLVSVCGRSGIKARTLADKINADFCTTNPQEIFDSEQVQAVLIGSRHKIHGQRVLEAMQAGKHLFVEKPLCLNLQELEAITEAYPSFAARGLGLFVGFNRRYSKHAEQAKTFFAENRQPLIMSFRVNASPLPPTHWILDPEVGGGRIIGETCHFIDFMQYVCGAPPSQISANRVGSKEQSILTIQFGDGSVGTVLYAVNGDQSMDKERFEAMGNGRSLVIHDFVRSEYFKNGKRTQFTSGTQDKGFSQEMKQFTDEICGLTQPSQTFEQIRSVTLATFQAEKSLRTGQVEQII
ncbi:MAG: bi-domain-containing oxidoreductase [Magnetococcales bacterium]|nr:bi-domain-containing oxidoreductase [Magnetococcales bacterium]